MKTIARRSFEIIELDGELAIYDLDNNELFDEITISVKDEEVVLK